jgi:hypothetical protein
MYAMNNAMNTTKLSAARKSAMGSMLAVAP